MLFFILYSLFISEPATARTLLSRSQLLTTIDQFQNLQSQAENQVCQQEPQGAGIAKDVAEIFSAFEKLKNQKPVWASVEPKNLRLGVVDLRTKKLFISGIDQTELQKLGLTANLCPGSSVYEISNPPAAFLEPYGAMRTLQPKEMSGHSVSTDPPTPEVFRENLKYPLDIFYFPIPIPPEYKDRPEVKILEKPSGLARVATHELFHSFQDGFKASKGRAGSRGVVNDALSKPGAFQKEVLEELVLWKKYDSEWESTTRAQDLELAKKIVDGRSKEATKGAWDRLAPLEFLEGTAVYFESMLSRGAGFKDASPWWGYPGDIKAEGLGEFGHESFYVSGAMICILLQKLDPKGTWQAEIESGQAPIDALRKLLSTPGK